MIKFICVIALFFSAPSVFAQTIGLHSDSVESFLCKRWQVDYAVIDGMKVGRMPGATDMYYDFKKDKTLILTDNRSNNATKGTWSYDPAKKIIKLTVNGKNNTNIVSLKSDELVMLVDTKEATPGDPTPIKIVYKVKTD